MPATGVLMHVVLLGATGQQRGTRHQQAIDRMRFIYFSVLLKCPSLSVPTIGCLCIGLHQNGAQAGSCSSPSLETSRCCTRPSALTSASTPRPLIAAGIDDHRAVRRVARANVEMALGQHLDIAAPAKIHGRDAIGRRPPGSRTPAAIRPGRRAAARCSCPETSGAAACRRL